MKTNFLPCVCLQRKLALLLAALCLQTSAFAVPAGWTLVWADEFDGSNINVQNWTFDTGGGGWGNNELEYYTDRPENARIENGNLVIEARKERYRNGAYTSARLKTQGLKTWTYGRIEARIKIPYGQGIWPAFWLLGNDINTVGWPGCGEVDIMENIGREPYTVHGTIHGPGYSGANGVGSLLTATTPWSDDYHLYAVEWNTNHIEWSVDDVPYFSVSPADLPGAWVFDHPFYIILNVAVGGSWPGSPDATTQFPQQMLVDYVRVYQPTNQPTPSGITIHVADTECGVNVTGHSWQAVAAVGIADPDGNPVPDATVSIAWSGLVSGGNTSLVTDSSGTAGPFYSNKTKKSGTIAFCVTSVSKSGATYDASANLKTCNSVSH